MKTAQATYGKSFAFIFLFLLSQRSFTQVRALYDQLDMSEVTSNYFYPQTLKDLVIPNPTTFDDELTPKKAASLFMAFDKACIDPNRASLAQRNSCVVCRQFATA